MCSDGVRSRVEFQFVVDGGWEGFDGNPLAGKVVISASTTSLLVHQPASAIRLKEPGQKTGTPKRHDW